MLGPQRGSALRATRRRSSGTAAVPVPFSTGAAWNIPAAGIATATGAGALDSATAVARLRQNTQFLCEFSSFTVPIYLSSSWDGVTTRTLAITDPDRHGSLAQGATLPWSAGWLPSFGPWDGTTAHDSRVTVLFDVAAGGFPLGTELDLWRVVDHADTGILACGTAVRVPQSYVTGDGRSEASRGCGLANRAMLVTPAEVAEGVIRHALALGIPNLDSASAASFQRPAITTDGPTTGQPSGVLAGSRFALTMTQTQIDAVAAALPAGVTAGMRTACKVLLRALVDYGFIVTNDAGTWNGTTLRGTGARFYDEDRQSGGAAWSALGLDQLTVGGVPYPYNLLKGVLDTYELRMLVPASAYAAADAAPFAGAFQWQATLADPAPATPATVHTFANACLPLTGRVHVAIVAKTGAAATGPTCAVKLGGPTGVPLTQAGLGASPLSGGEFLWQGTTAGAVVGSLQHIEITTSIPISQVLVFVTDIGAAFDGTTGRCPFAYSNSNLATTPAATDTPDVGGRPLIGVANWMKAGFGPLAAAGWTALAQGSLGLGTNGNGQTAALFTRAAPSPAAPVSLAATGTGAGGNPNGSQWLEVAA